MYYGEIKNCDIANGEGVRVTLFVSGCTNHCKNCFQPQTWDFCYGQPFTTETEDYLLSLLSPVYINGLTLLGGEPFEPENQRALVPFLRRVRCSLRLRPRSIRSFSVIIRTLLISDSKAAPFQTAFVCPFYYKDVLTAENVSFFRRALQKTLLDFKR